MRDHVDLAEDIANDVLVSGRMCQRGPVGAWDFPPLGRFSPERTNFAGRFCFGELVDRGLVPFVERFVQQLGGRIPLCGQQHALPVQLMIAHPVGRKAGLYEDLLQFTR